MDDSDDNRYEEGFEMGMAEAKDLIEVSMKLEDKGYKALDLLNNKLEELEKEE